MAEYPYDGPTPERRPMPRRRIAEQTHESQVRSELHAGGPERESGIRGGITGRPSERAESRKARVADRVERLGQRIEDRARPFESRGGVRGRAGRAAHRAGDALEGGAEYLRTHDIPTMRDDVSQQIRSHPIVSIGVAFGAGLLLSRALGGDEEHEEPREEEDRHEREEEPERESMLGRAARPFMKAALGGATAALGKQVRDRVAGR